MEWFKKFMVGRYGVDLLSRFLTLLALLISLVNMFTRYKVLSLVSMLILLLVVYRTFSKKTYKRIKENQVYYNLSLPIRSWLSKVKNRFKTRKEYKYFKCSECKKDLRVPRNKGKIVVTCPECGYKMETKS